ncbi:MAG TPA: ATP-dependent helicase HrpB [Stellaceae bacterium]|nr:ATP-dependent helicase HrpB [Stellaceae bacterium]
MTPRDLARWSTALPVGEALPALGRALAAAGAAVLQAPPGAGKTTLVPLALLDAPWLGGRRIVMLEPRRLAARAAAQRMAEMLGERVGDTVGYRTRLDTRIGPKTRVEVVTEGILLRQIQDDPSLDGVGLVVFDEFHERNLDGDLGLALALETQRHLREELRLLVMSATLEGERVAQLLGDAPVIVSAGQSFPVRLTFLGRPPPERMDAAIAAAIRRALAEEEGSLLVFLPGGAEIRRIERLVGELTGELGVTVAPLYGDLPQAAQDAAIRPASPGRRKLVLATPIAETSLTIEGIRVVIDSGLRRVPRFDPATGMTRLETVRVSQASAEQRRGRAGRLAPGACYRLWSETEQAQLRPFTAPEILEADLAPLALELARWGTPDPTLLAWLDPPPAAAFTQGCTLLGELDALDRAGRITAHGHAMARLGLHPRLAHMVLVAKARGEGRLAAEIAALLGERDIVRAAPGQRDADLRLRLELLHRRGEAGHLPPGLTLERGAAERVRQAARLLQRQSQLGENEAPAPDAAGRLLAQAYPDRIAQRRPGAPGQFRLSNGRGAELPPADPLAAEEFLAAAELDGERRVSRIFLAAPLTRAAIEEDFAAAIETSEIIAWDSRQEAVLARRQERLFALVLKDEPMANPPAERVAAAMIDGIRELGLAALPWSREADSLRQRVLFLRRMDEAADWPDLSDAALLAALEHWLGPYLGGIFRRAQLERLDLAEMLRSGLSFEQQRALDRLAPTHVTVPSGSRLSIDYAGETPVLAVRLQEMFGARQTPAIADGRVPLLLHLLSPAGRPLQVTRDLEGFWRGSYPAVRGEMRGRYPKHPWPEDPLAAPPTARAKRKAR